MSVEEQEEGLVEAAPAPTELLVTGLEMLTLRLRVREKYPDLKLDWYYPDQKTKHLVLHGKRVTEYYPKWKNAWLDFATNPHNGIDLSELATHPLLGDQSE